MVRREEDQSVASGALGSAADVPIEVDSAFNATIWVVGMQVALDHQEEAFGILGQDLDCLIGCCSKIEIGSVPEDDCSAGVLRGRRECAIEGKACGREAFLQIGAHLVKGIGNRC